jgi:hypothetical protein
VACSGNFTVERILAQAELENTHGCDISLYSCLVGAHLAGDPFRLEIKDEEFAWLRDYLDDEPHKGPKTIATLLLCSNALQFAKRDRRYERRMWAAYRAEWDSLHRATMAKVATALEGMHLRSFAAEDAVTWVARAPDDAVVISFPPTYDSGYERLYKHIDAVFDWDAPTYEVFTEQRFGMLQAAIVNRDEWVLSRDRPEEALAPYQVALIQMQPRAKPTWIYAGTGNRHVFSPHQQLEPVPVRRLEEAIGPDDRIELIKLTVRQLNTLRSEYLDPSIAPAAPQMALGVLVGGKLAGCAAFSSPTFSGGFCDVYMMTDLAIRPTVNKRLSKLVLAAVVSHEARALLEMLVNRRVQVIGTTAFTKKAVSMKYRGLFKEYSRKKDSINYVANAGRWSLEEALVWWRTQSA